VAAVEQMAHALGMPVSQIPRMEADDVMATLARRAEQDGLDGVLITGDKDLVQLVSDRVKVLAPLRRGEEYVWIDRAGRASRNGAFPPEHVVDVLALLGDTIDNVPGFPGSATRPPTSC
jgi:DNA polymerase-1